MIERNLHPDEFVRTLPMCVADMSKRCDQYEVAEWQYALIVQNLEGVIWVVQMWMNVPTTKKYWPTKNGSVSWVRKKRQSGYLKLNNHFHVALS